MLLTKKKELEPNPEETNADRESLSWADPSILQAKDSHWNLILDDPIRILDP